MLFLTHVKKGRKNFEAEGLQQDQSTQLQLLQFEVIFESLLFHLHCYYFLLLTFHAVLLLEATTLETNPQ